MKATSKNCPGIKSMILLFILVVDLSCIAQKNASQFLGEWSAQVVEEDPFLFQLLLEHGNNEESSLTFTGQDTTTVLSLTIENQFLVGHFKDQIQVRIHIENEMVTGFLAVGHHLCHIDFVFEDRNRWKATWNLLIAESIYPTLYLDIDRQLEDRYVVLSYFREPSLHYMAADSLTYSEDQLRFKDVRSNIRFLATKQELAFELQLSFLNEITVCQMERMPRKKWEIGTIEDENLKRVHPINTNNDRFADLTQAINSDTLERTHAVVISQSDQLIYEQYFDGFSHETIHDTRSVSKSFAAALIGIAVESKLLSGEYEVIKPYFDQKYPKINWKNGKDAVTVHHLLTMSSGIDAIDFGINRTSFANEANYQNELDWTHHILSAPMVSKIGIKANYGSGSAHLLAPILEAKVDEPLEFYIHKKLLRPLDITNYRIQTDRNGVPYFGGGWYFTPRDLIKFAELYLHKGRWKNKSIISGDWIEKSFTKHVTLENTFDKNKFGYMLWHKTYEVGNQDIESIECRGSGGQYVFMMPKLELAVVITSGNYNNGKGFQPERIMRDYILPKLVER